MKKVFIDLKKVQYVRRSYLPKFDCRHGRGTSANMAYKSDGGETDDDDDDDESEKKTLLKTIEKRVQKQLAGRASKEDVENVAKQLIFLTKGKNEKGEDVDSPFPIETLREMADPKSGVMTQLVDMGLRVKKIEE